MTVTGATAAPGTAAITAVVDGYAERLRADDVEGVLDLYADDAIVLPDGFEGAAGRTALRGLYAGILSSVSIDSRITIDDVAVWGDTASVCGHSTDSMTTRTSGGRTVAQFRELFVLRRDPDWKIARYMFQRAPGAAGA